MMFRMFRCVPCRQFLVFLGILCVMLYINTRRHNIYIQTKSEWNLHGKSQRSVNSEFIAVQNVEEDSDRKSGEKSAPKTVPNVPKKGIAKERMDRRNKRPMMISIKDMHRYEISGSKDHNFSYCMVYKAATTSWLRIIRFLNGEHKEVERPHDVSKYRVHYYKIAQYIKYFNYKKDKDFVENSQRIMTVRDPYTRLWSGYIDKFLLPDFWKTRGLAIISLVRNNTKGKGQKRCGDDVTFKEFIDYVILQDGAMKAWDQDKHWLPATAMCRQEEFKPHIVLKQEQLSKEMPKTLQKLKLENILDKMKGINLTEFEMKDQVEYVFRIGGLGCVNRLKLAELVWKAYRYNAYIPADIDFPRQKFSENVTAAKMITVLEEVRKNWKVTKEERKKQKRDAMVAAFSTLPRETLNKLRDVYMKDFETYGYESEPADLFKR